MTRPGEVLPLIERIDRFQRRHPEIRIRAPYWGSSGKWEVSEPDHATVAYDRGADMISDLERRRPPAKP